MSRRATQQPNPCWLPRLALLLCVCVPSQHPAHADEPAQPAPTRIVVSPPTLNLSGTRDGQRVVVQAQYADGLTRDVTAEAAYSFENPEIARLDGATLLPRADGETSLKVAFQGQEAQVPVKVAHAGSDPALSFRLDVMPVFMRAGCNTGSCHGAARGKDGFRISLFGFDPDGDYHRMTRELVGRRINLAVPAESTLIEKSLGLVPHTGGKRFEPGSESHRILLDWITAGAPNDDVSKLPQVVGLELYPKSAVLDGAGATQQMVARAVYSDGTDRDVTSMVVFLTNNETSARVSENGLITAGDRGEAFVMARYDTFTVGSQILTLPRGLQFQESEEAPANYIDKLVADKLRKLRMSPSRLCSDEEFLRRVTLDIVGLAPSVEEYHRFMSSTEPDKREKLVNELLDRKEFAEIWVNKWAELLQVRQIPNQISQKGMFLYYNWLVDRLQKNIPMDQFVQELLGASGGTFSNPATNFYQTTNDRLLLTENVAQVFMGMRIQCAQCHNHPFDRWTMNDYYSFSAFFAQIGRKQGEDYRETVVFNAGGGEAKHPLTGQDMKPRFLGGAEPDVGGKDRRAVLAAWIGSPENPFFARSFVNRVWAHYFGIGIVEPVDDFRVSNPASNPELLDELANRFTASKYDLKQLVREICGSHAYQRSTERNATNELDEKNFAHANLRRIKAENLLDVISEATDTRDKFPGLPLGARAVQIADGAASTYFLTTFGRATRETVCSCEVKMEPTLSQALHLLNGDTVNRKIAQGGVIKRLLAEKKFPEERIAELFVRTLARMPTPREIEDLQVALNSAPSPEQGLLDIYWALLNSREFLFNH